MTSSRHHPYSSSVFLPGYLKEGKGKGERGKGKGERGRRGRERLTECPQQHKCKALTKPCLTSFSVGYFEI